MNIIYTGDFKLLKAMGYTFQKLFAANYICYHRDGIWIWRKGKDVEIGDLYGNSYLILQYLIEQNFNIGNQLTHKFIINMAELTLEKFDSSKHESFFLMSKEEVVKYNETHRQFYLNNETILPLKELYEKKLIKIQ